MRSRARMAGHAIHPMLIVFPLGLLSTSVIFDILYLITDNHPFAVSAAYTLAAGVISGPIAGVFGVLDWLKVPGGTRAKRVGFAHAAANGLAVVLFALSWWMRGQETAWVPNGWAIALSLAGAAVALVGAWLGGELVERLGIGVEPDADVDAPSSLRHSPI